MSSHKVASYSYVSKILNKLKEASLNTNIAKSMANLLAGQLVISNRVVGLSKLISAI